MKLRAAALALLTIACSQAGVSQAAKSPGPAVSSTPTNPTRETPLIDDLPLTKVDFNCRLPVVRSSTGGDSVTYTGGFVSFPGGNLVSDPAGDIRSRYAQQDFATDATPALYGLAQDGPPFYDLAQRRWVPASSAQSTADGASYAYSNGQLGSTKIKVHVVNVGSATERVFDVTEPERAQVVDFGPAGVYLLLPSALGGPGEGVWLLNPATGVVQRLRMVQQVMAVRDGYAWVGRIDPRDPNPPQLPEGTTANSLVRVDLASGVETPWYYRPGANIWLRGFDSGGKPVIAVTGPAAYDTGEIRLVGQPATQGTLVYPGGLPLMGPQGDGDRLWFGGPGGIYLFKPGHGLQKVFASNGDPKLAENIQPAGFCR